MGHYVNRFDTATGSFGAKEDHVFPLRVTFTGVGSHFSGEMTDEAFERAYLYRSMVESAAGEALSPSQRQMAKGLLERYPDLRITSILPERSLIAGTLMGRSIEFAKTYQGLSITRWAASNAEFSDDVKSQHRVLYRGTVSEDGLKITGTWCIPKRGIAGLFGAKAGDGTFELWHSDGHGYKANEC